MVYPPNDSARPLVLRAHEELYRRHGVGAILTVPLERQGHVFGCLTFERAANAPFAAETVLVAQTAATMAGAVLETRRRESRWVVAKVGESLKIQAERLVGPGYVLRKLIVALAVAATLFFTVFHIDYRVSAKASLEGAVQRVVAAPFNGYVMEAPARPGDVVASGDLLCLLDDRDLRLERIRWETEQEQFSKQYQEALAKHDRPQVRVLSARIDQAQARIALLDEQLARTRVTAPFDGVVTSGDLSQSLGAPVERGQVLFEVAPLGQYRLVLEVDERDIGQLVVGQPGELVLPSLPGEKIAFTINKLTPVSTAKEGRNYFRVEGLLNEVSQRLRPGMEGIGKTTVDRRRLIWVWTHEAVDWLRLQLWRWWP
jgi:RND family efflux transporter MFP subunit